MAIASFGRDKCSARQGAPSRWLHRTPAVARATMPRRQPSVAGRLHLPGTDEHAALAAFDAMVAACPAGSAGCSSAPVSPSTPRVTSSAPRCKGPSPWRFVLDIGKMRGSGQGAERRSLEISMSRRGAGQVSHYAMPAVAQSLFVGLAQPSMPPSPAAAMIARCRGSPRSLRCCRRSSARGHRAIRHAVAGRRPGARLGQEADPGRTCNDETVFLN